MLRVPRKRRPPDRDFPPLSTPAAQQTQSNFHVVPANLEAWTRSLVIDFWRSATFRQHTRATLQEYDLVMKKCQEENINFGLDSEAWTQSLLHENVSIEIDFHRNTFGAYCNTYNYTRILSLRRL